MTGTADVIDVDAMRGQGMDFTFTPEQDGLRAALGRALTRSYDLDHRKEIIASPAGWSEDVWTTLVDMGLTAIPFPEAVGGAAGSIVDLVAAAEVLGAHIVVEPWVPSVVLAGGVLAAVVERSGASAGGGTEDAGLAAHWLTQIVEGSVVAALAHEEGRGTPDPSLVRTTAEAVPASAGDSGHVLTGEKAAVLAGASAEVLVVTAQLDGKLAVFVVERGAGGGDAARSGDAARGGGAAWGSGAARTGGASGGSSAITGQEFTTIDGRRAAHLRFDRTPALLLAADSEDLVRDALGGAVVVLAAEAVGAMERLLATTAEYVATRKQFGVPIGSFQAIAHRLADMKIAFTKANATLLYTTALAEAGLLTPRDVSVLKAQVGRYGRDLGEAAIQNHGGVGMTDELVVGHLHKRILAVNALLGPAEYHQRVLGAPRT